MHQTVNDFALITDVVPMWLPSEKKGFILYIRTEVTILIHV